MKTFIKSIALISLCLSATSAFALSTRQCNPKIPKTIQYRPVHKECGNKAALIFSGKYTSLFSVVFKKVDHNDRLANNCPDAKCSPFKTQKTIRKNGKRIACFGAAGNSPVFRGYDPDAGYSPSYVVKWISIKTRSVEGLPLDKALKYVEIYCMPKPYPITKIN